MTKETVKVTFVDKNRERFVCTIELRDKEGGKELSIRSENGQGKFVPANGSQKRLFDLWDIYHLNGMNAGTPNQQKAIKKWLTDGKQYDYTKACEYLKCLNPDGTELSALKKAHLEENIAAVELEIKRFKTWIDEFEKTVEKYSKKSDGYFIFDFKRFGFTHDSIVDEAYGKKQEGIWLDHRFSLQDFVKRFKSFCEKKGNNLTKQIADLEMQTLYVDKNPETGEPHKYGHSWYHRPLPEDIEEQIEEIVQEIEEAEEERKGEPLDKLSDEELIALIEEKTSFEGRDAELAVAFVRLLDLTENDLDDIEIDDHRSTVQGIDYLAGTDEEMDEEWDQDLEHYLDECVTPDLPDVAQRFFDREGWKDWAKQDGRAHSLNRYNGEELSVEVNGTMYYAYRQ